MTKLVAIFSLALGLALASCADTSGAADAEQPEPTPVTSVATTELSTTTSTASTTTSSTTTASTTSTTTTSSPPTTVTPTTSVASMETPWSFPIEGEVRPAADLPTLLLSWNGMVNRQVQGGNQGLVNLPHDVGDVYGTDGWTVVERVESSDQGYTVIQLLASHEGSNFDPLQFPERIEPHLLDVESIEGEPRVLVHLYDPNTDGETAGRILLVDPTGETDPVEVAVGAAPEYFVSGGSMTQDLIALSAFADLTEVVSFTTIDGDELDRPSPTDDLPYGQPPLLTEAALADDATSMAYLSGPDHGPEGLSDDPLELVIVNAEGEEVYRQVLIENAQDLAPKLDFDGRWAVVSLPQAPNPVPPLLIDTTAEKPIGYLAAPGGFASIEG